TMDLIMSVFYEEELSVWEKMQANMTAVFEATLPYLITAYWYVFFTLMIVATSGRKLKLRKLYIKILNKIFSWVSVKMVVEDAKEKEKRRMSLTEEEFTTDDDSDENILCDTNSPEEAKAEKYGEKKPKSCMSDAQTNETTFSSKASSSLQSSWEDLNVDIQCRPDDALKKTDISIPSSSHNLPSEDTTEIPQERREYLKFSLDALMVYLSAGIRAVVDDCVNKSFSREQLKTWNLLSRTIARKDQIRKSRSLAGFFFVGLVIRYCFLMPMRMLVLCLSLSNLTLWTFIVGCLPDGPFKRMINSYVVSWGFDFVASSLSVVARFHDKENRPSHGIAVANHTSPIDGMILATDNCYDMVGQRTKGLLGMFMNALAKSSAHIWFERSDARDRQATTRLLWEHTQRPELPPILIFPEGVCVNNTAVLEFRKGAFEVDCDIFPIAVKFDPVYGDAFWFEGGFFSYCLSMMTSWAIVCDIHYLPPMRKQPDESASHFANRVRSVIAKKVGLLELQWNSLVKSSIFGTEKWDKLKTDRQREQQRQFVRRLSSIEVADQYVY
ncbi:Phospholipid/glycerol acyltransferase, partial [Trinorchestia longiramus]